MQGWKTAFLSKLLDFTYFHFCLETWQGCVAAVIQSQAGDGTGQSPVLPLKLRWHSRVCRWRNFRKTLARVFPTKKKKKWPFTKGKFWHGEPQDVSVVSQGCSFGEFVCLTGKKRKTQGLNGEVWRAGAPWEHQPHGEQSPGSSCSTRAEPWEDFSHWASSHGAAAPSGGVVSRWLEDTRSAQDLFQCRQHFLSLTHGNVSHFTPCCQFSYLLFGHNPLGDRKSVV